MRRSFHFANMIMPYLFVLLITNHCPLYLNHNIFLTFSIRYQTPHTMKKRTQNIVRNYFTFSRKQRNGIVVAIALLFACLVIRFSYSFFIAPKTVAADSAFINQVAALKLSDTNKNIYAKNYTRNYSDADDANYNEPKRENYTAKGELFIFDPNTLSAEGWKRLGLRDKTIQTILNYTSKGGKFRQPGDIKKIYGLFPNQAERLMPYVKIATTSYANSNNAEPNNKWPRRDSFPKHNTYFPKTIDINTADTSAFIALPGIGSKLAARIVNFREKLGGFYSINQLGETYGLPDSVFQKIKPGLTISLNAVTKLNINLADLNTLKSHPGIRYNIANAIVEYRKQHGNYMSVNDLRKIAIIDEAVFQKLVPYLTIE